uniref:Reverse transcriptase domain-containing protein n=1 Tax=Tribolium castaneum TaxID=7070 RepID=F7IYV6_TRICA|nr:unnamed protein product [Tribolium castaneum]
MNCIQLNMNRSQTVHDCLYCLARKLDTHILIVSEPNKKHIRKGGWYVDELESAAIKILSRDIKVLSWGSELGFIWVQTSLCYVFGCYISPNVSFNDFENYLYRLRDSLRGRGGAAVVAGDFNAKAYAWGSHTEDARGSALADLIGELNMVVINRGEKPTFQRGESASFIDVTFSSSNMAGSVVGWEVLDAEVCSDHLPISFKIDVAKRLPNPPFPRGGWKWDEDKRDGLADCLHRRLLGSDLLMAEDLTEAIGKACDESLLRKKGNYAGRRPVYWWTPEVKASWKASTESKRKLMRANRNRAVREQQQDLLEKLKEMHRTARKELRRQIRRAKAKAWESLVESVDQDPWGRAYQIATRKMRIDVLPTEGEVARAVQKLFSVRPEIRWAIPEVETPRAFTTEELRTATQRLRSGKAAGPDGIPAEVVRLAVEVSAGTVLRVMNDSLAGRKFPERWKRARLVLIPKDGRDSEGNLKLRPICLLDCLGKLLEQLLRARLLEELEERGGFSEHQYGFREGRSTLDAMEEAIKFAHFACSVFWGRKDLCALTTVNVENAFNTAPWDKIVDALTGRNISPGLTAMVMSYLEGRRLIVGDDQEIAVTCGVPQGSVLGPILWNVMYDAVLRLDLPVGARTLAFADDLALLTTARTEDELMRLTNEALSEIARWMVNAELKLATVKTESVLLVGYRRPGAIQLSIGDEVIRPQKSIRYLGVYLDQQMSFTPHIQQTVARTERTIAMLGRLMPNLGGPASGTRKLLNSVATSILLYGSEVWVDGLRFQQNKKLLVAVQRRSLLKVISGYRTVSAEAAQVIAGVPPIILLAEERASLRRGTDRRVARSRIMARWQREWEEAENGKWTRALIPDVETWANRGHGTVNFYLTQALSGHGCFGSFLFRIGKSDSDACWYCGEKDDPKHTLFYCVRWEEERLKVMKARAQWPVLDNFTDLLLQGPDEWEAVKRMARNILRKKEADERRLEEERQVERWR